ncbi:DNA/RNA endonuclease G [Pseudoteredinibacter isoporae]|nr:DNA/RNA endonuclease G [Pseudoteredinibacter isoporae]NIB24108.1 DNA/RNA endonuclease G [Pseudoteredinibacter isoporae]
MNDPFQMQREMRYGAPVCDEILAGRYFTIGYSWYFRQAKWVLEIVNPEARFEWDVERADNFRADIRVPERFRGGLTAYKNSGFDRGHLVASANQDELHIQNSETFLLSNMSPQHPDFNRKIWRKLEKAVRKLNGRSNVLETYVLTAPVFYFDREVETIGSEHEEYGIDIPVPHAFVKSILAEESSGKLKLWTFEMENRELNGDLGEYLVNTYDAEQKVGGRFWDRISGKDMHKQKSEPGEMWDLR